MAAYDRVRIFSDSRSNIESLSHRGRQSGLVAFNSTCNNLQQIAIEVSGGLICRSSGPLVIEVLRVRN